MTNNKCTNIFLAIILLVLLLIAGLFIAQYMGFDVLGKFGIEWSPFSTKINPEDANVQVTKCADYDGVCYVTHRKGFEEHGILENCRGTIPNCDCDFDTCFPTECHDGRCDSEICSNWNIASIFNQWFGTGTVNDAQANCEAGGGKWWEIANEVGCQWPTPVAFDCDSEYATQGKEICGNMGATWSCRPDLGYVGCWCPISGGESHFLDPNDWYCGEYYGSSGYCNGWCDMGSCFVYEGQCDCWWEEGDGECPDTECDTHPLTDDPISCYESACDGASDDCFPYSATDPQGYYFCTCVDRADEYSTCSLMTNEFDCLEFGMCRVKSPFGDWFEGNCGWDDQFGQCVCPFVWM